MAIQQTYNTGISNRSDFRRNDFETLIQQKGRRVILSKSLVCPCKAKATNQQSNCKNCGGCGWVFINPKETRMVLQGMNLTPDYKAWSQEIQGDLKVTASDTEELTYMDRIEVLDANSIFNEVLFFKKKPVGDDFITFAYTSYNIKEIKYIGYFQGTDKTFKKLIEGIDYIKERNIITLINSDVQPIQGEISITIRYVHAPIYLMIDIKRESMESFEMIGKEKLIHLPVSAIARRQHYELQGNNLFGDRLLDNSGDIINNNCEMNLVNNYVKTIQEEGTNFFIDDSAALKNRKILLVIRGVNTLIPSDKKGINDASLTYTYYPNEAKFSFGNELEKGELIQILWQKYC